MNYKRIYSELIVSRQNLLRTRKGGVYYERHHILPKSLGGTNTKDNLVLLTAKEHFLAHKLLIQINVGIARKKMICAFWFMCGNKTKNRIATARQYEYGKVLFSSVLKGSKLTAEHKQKVSLALKGKPSNLSQEGRKKISEAMANYRKGKTWSDEHKDNIRNTMKGRKMSKEFSERMMKKINQFSLDGEFIQQWDSLKIASESLHISYTGLSQCCSGKYKNSGGFTWAYAHI
jgi:hypothetical protein